MRSPVNVILTAMACCDTVVLFSNLIYTTHYTFAAFLNCQPEQWSYGWAVFLICHAHLSLIGHSSSIWLSVMLALIRYMTLRSRRKVNVLQIHLQHSYMAIVFVILFVAVMNTPNFLAYKIFEMKLSETCNITDSRNIGATAYLPGVSDLALEAHCLIFRMAFWISGTIFKMIPCLLLSSFLCLLMKILTKVRQNRLKLLRNSTRFYNEKDNTKDEYGRGNRSTTASRTVTTTSFSKTNPVTLYRTDRTTRMLLTILCVFLITELPQGIMMEFKQVFLPHSIFGYELKWKLKRHWEELPSEVAVQTFGGTTFNNCFISHLDSLNRNTDRVCSVAEIPSELLMGSPLKSPDYADNEPAEKSNTIVENTRDDEDASLL
uniref:G-protein coupled receptors family 1 profile domain-containing protein n=1 Tax=Setaria digitata TaxID=48799 RepID=A0A915PS18_9BILA